MNNVINDANRLGGQLETVIDAYLVAFVVHYFGIARLQVDEQLIRFMPEETWTRVRFYFDDTALNEIAEYSSRASKKLRFEIRGAGHGMSKVTYEARGSLFRRA